MDWKIDLVNRENIIIESKTQILNFKQNSPW